METDGASSGANHVNRSQAPEAETVVRTFLIADVRGYTSFTHAHGDFRGRSKESASSSVARQG